MEVQLTNGVEPVGSIQEPLRDSVRRPSGNEVRETQPNVYLEEYLSIRRTAGRPDVRVSQPVSLLDFSTAGDIYNTRQQRATTERRPDERTPEEVAQRYSDDASRSLRRAITDRNLQYTTDGEDPAVLEYNNAFRTTAPTTALALAQERLGENASEEQLAKYAAVIVTLNRLDAPDSNIDAGRDVKLPGQTADGGITYWIRGNNITEWHDGSVMRVTERGQGTANFTDRRAGCDVEITWDPEKKENCSIERTYPERSIKIDANGVRTERIPPDWGLKSRVYQDTQGRRVAMDYNPANSSLLRVTVNDRRDGSIIELEPEASGGLRGKKSDQAGDVLETVGATIVNNELRLFTERTADSVTTRTHENGTVEQLREGRIASRTGTDEWGRRVEEVFRPAGRVPPHQIHVTLNDNTDESKRTRLTFTRTDFGDYFGETMKDGRVDLRYQLKPSGQIMFFRGQRVYSDLKDGTRLERSQLYDANDPRKVSGYQISQTRDGATYSVFTDRDGTVQRDRYQYGGPDGRTIERRRSINGRQFTGISMSESTGHRTELEYDSLTGLMSGNRRDREGRVVENVVVADDKIIYTNPSGSRRIEVLDLSESNLLGKRPRPGMYNAQEGTEQFENDDESLSVQTVAPGRTDRVMHNPCDETTTINGTTIRGERSAVTPTSTVVHSPDRTGIRLNEDNTIDRWGPREEDNALREPLTDAERDFLAHMRTNGRDRDIDMRDFIEIHRQQITKPGGAARLERFYTALKTLDETKNLTGEERTALRRNIMRDVAHPEEINQSRSPTCNTEVIRRELAMNCPDEYVLAFHNAMNNGRVPIYTRPVDGAYGAERNRPTEFVTVDPANLKLTDSTGRNLAARIFDNMAIQVSVHPEYQWVATEDGVGRLVPRNPDDEPRAFNGMQMGEIATVLTQLTGVNRGVVQMFAVDDMRVAFEQNGRRSMIVAVNASRSPFSWQGPDFDNDELVTNHVVTLSDMYSVGTGTHVQFMNQWGLESDHSTRSTAVSVERFLNNMTGVNTSWRGARPMTPPQAITTGDPNKVYRVVDGKIVEDARFRIREGRVQER